MNNNWEDKLKILINEWVKRLIKFDSLTEVNPYPKGGFTVYECPDIEPFIHSLLTSERSRWQKETRERLEKLKKNPMTNKEINEVIRLNEGNIDYADIKDLDIRQAHGYNQAISDALAIIGGGK